MDLPHSDACFVRAYPAATAEAWVDGHVHAFAFFGRVPISVLYDNTDHVPPRGVADGLVAALSGIAGKISVPRRAG
jgi:transposase